MLNLKGLTDKFKINRYFGILFILSIITGSIKEMIILFFFVLLHELSHTIAVVSYKLRIDSIELFPFGGVAKIDNLEGVETSKEILIAVAGPASNLLSAMIVLALDKAGVDIPYYRYIMNINITLALFNLMPGLPLDGGRIIRAVLSYFVGFKKATKASVISGKAVSVLMFLFGIIAYLTGDINISLFLLPLFIFISASKEEGTITYTIMKNVINKSQHLSSRGVMEITEICAFENTFAREVLKYFDLDKYHMIVVVDSEMVIQGMLTETELINGLSSCGGDITLEELVEKIYK